MTARTPEDLARAILRSIDTAHRKGVASFDVITSLIRQRDAALESTAPKRLDERYPECRYDLRITRGSRRSGIDPWVVDVIDPNDMAVVASSSTARTLASAVQILLGDDDMIERKATP